MSGTGILTRGGRCGKCKAWLHEGQTVEWYEEGERNRFRHEGACPPRSGSADLPSVPPGATTGSTLNPSASSDYRAESGYSVSVEVNADNPDGSWRTVKISRLYLTREQVDATAVDLLAVAKKVLS